LTITKELMRIHHPFALLVLAFLLIACTQITNETTQAAPVPGAPDLRVSAHVAAADLAAIRYREGTVDFLVLLDAQRERLAAEDAQAQAEVDLYRGIVAIYKALGGGWQPDTVVATAK